MYAGGGALKAPNATTALKHRTYAAVEKTRRNRRGDSRSIAAAACHPAQVGRDHRRNDECGDAPKPPWCVAFRRQCVIGESKIDCY